MKNYLLRSHLGPFRSLGRETTLKFSYVNIGRTVRREKIVIICSPNLGCRVHRQQKLDFGTFVSPNVSLPPLITSQLSPDFILHPL